jgi:hypothetical protein
MYRQLLEHSPLLVLPIVALFLFIAVFCGIVLRTYGRKAESYAKDAGLPLEGDRHD